MTCEKATSLVQKHEDKKLSRTERFNLWLHVLFCTMCAMFFKQSKIVDATARSYAGKVDSGQKVYLLRPQRKAQIGEELDAQLNK